MSERKKKETPGPRGTPEWMVTFSDIMSLLVTFFVLLMTFSSFDPVRFDLVAGSLRGSFGVARELREDDASSVIDRLRLMATRSREGAEALPDYQPLDWIEREIVRQLEMLEVLKFVDLAHMDRGLVLRIQDEVMFKRGSAQLGKRSRDILAAVGAALQYIGNRLVVEGHTDDAFLPTRKFRTDVELSLERAIAVSDRLIELGLAPRRMGAAGAGRHRPLVPNTNARVRALNRRVEITIMPPPRKGVDA